LVSESLFIHPLQTPEWSREMRENPAVQFSSTSLGQNANYCPWTLDKGVKIEI